jgi:hypothetical protein
MNSRLFRDLIIAIIAVTGINIILFFASSFFTESKAKDVQGEVTVSLQIPRQMTFRFKPENRIPNAGNDSLDVNVQFKNMSNQVLYQVDGTTDNDGYVLFDSIPADQVPTGNVIVSVKGLSHLRRNLPVINIIPHWQYSFDFDSYLLKAGDAHPTADNYINGLDISYLLINLYGTDLRADLNRDGVVNSLDVSNILTNLYESGDE